MSPTANNTKENQEIESNDDEAVDKKMDSKEAEKFTPASKKNMDATKSI